MSTPPTLVEVASDVYVYAQPDGGWCLNNAGVLVGPEGVMVVDTAATERRALSLRAAVDGLCAGPVRAVVNTHHHGDHTFGNAIVGPSAVLVAHDRTRMEMAETGLALTSLWPDVAWGDVRVLLPTLTFPDRLTWYLGDRQVELMHVGPAHTTNDVVVWLPQDRVLFAGDVVLSGCTPFNLMGSVRGALDAVERLRALRPATVVCGHGTVAGPEVFDVTTKYLTWIQGVALRSRRAGLAPLAAAREAGSGDFDHLIDPERVVGNLHRAYAELEDGELGRSLDVVSIFAEMVEYNGGKLPVCRA